MGGSGIYATGSAVLDRDVQIGIAGEKLISLSFPASAEGSDDEHPLLRRIEAFLDGETDDFRDVNVGLTVPTDEREVLEATREIPYGERTSVEGIVRMTPSLEEDSDEDIETVRKTLRENPIPLIVPDHRVDDGPWSTPESIARHLQATESE